MCSLAPQPVCTLVLCVFTPMYEHFFSPPSTAVVQYCQGLFTSLSLLMNVFGGLMPVCLSRHTMFLLHVCVCLFGLANFLLSVWNEFIAVRKPLSMDPAVDTASCSSLTVVLFLCVKGSGADLYASSRIRYVTCYCRIARMNILLHDVLFISGEQYVRSNTPTHIQTHMRVHPERRQ